MCVVLPKAKLNYFLKSQKIQAGSTSVVPEHSLEEKILLSSLKTKSFVFLFFPLIFSKQFSAI